MTVECLFLPTPRESPSVRPQLLSLLFPSRFNFVPLLGATISSFCYLFSGARRNFHWTFHWPELHFIGHHCSEPAGCLSPFPTDCFNYHSKITGRLDDSLVALPRTVAFHFNQEKRCSRDRFGEARSGGSVCREEDSQSEESVIHFARPSYVSPKMGAFRCFLFKTLHYEQPNHHNGLDGKKCKPKQC